MSTIKQRRLEEIEVACHPGTTVGQYVPFYFCPRSIMLYILRMGNHPDVIYRGGQQPIVHLQADFHQVITWANSNAALGLSAVAMQAPTSPVSTTILPNFGEIDWEAVTATDFRDAKIKEGKQAEFLLFNVFPWTLIEKVGTINNTIATKAQTALAIADHQPSIAIEPTWYF